MLFITIITTHRLLKRTLVASHLAIRRSLMRHGRTMSRHLKMRHPLARVVVIERSWKKPAKSTRKLTRRPTMIRVKV